MLERQSSSQVGFWKRTERTLNKLLGYKAEPRTIVRPFVMMKSVQDQEKLIYLSAKSIWDGLARTRVDSGVVGQVIYDMFYTLNDVESAKYLLENATRRWGKEKARMAMASAPLLRIHMDNAPVEEQRPFYEFCEDHGLEIASIALEDMRKFSANYPEPLMTLLSRTIGNY